MSSQSNTALDPGRRWTHQLRDPDGVHAIPGARTAGLLYQRRGSADHPADFARLRAQLGATFGATNLWSAQFSNAAGWLLGPEYYSTIRLP